MSSYPNIFRSLPLNNGKVVLKNRILMGSMHSGLEEIKSAKGLDAMAEYFAARSECGICVTGGIAPNAAGRVKYFAAKLSTRGEVKDHRVVTERMHEAGGKIAMQILHTGRYGYHHQCVAPSPIKAPIGMFTPNSLSGTQVEKTIDEMVKCAELAVEAGYDGVEIMGSEGYLINQFIAAEVNKRTDEWGGAYDNRIRLATEIVRRTRQAIGEEPVIIFRLSMLDLVKGGSSLEEVIQLAQALETCGVSIINTGIGWHEARIPTIATTVPRAGFAWVTRQLMNKVKVPLCTTNRINMPSTAEEALREGYADMVSMARPLLADPKWVEKAKEGREEEINTCIGCNQACLDHVFVGKRASCLVNPQAGYESELRLDPATDDVIARTSIAVVGAGPAGLACATACATRGFKVTLFEKQNQIGGQFNMAKRIPGKEEFFETVRYFGNQISKLGVDLKLQTTATDERLAGFSHVVIATGVVPRSLPSLETHEKAVSYVDVLKGKVHIGNRVAIIGAGGIGFDVAEFLSDPKGQLTQDGPAPGMASEKDIAEFCDEWGIDRKMQSRGGVMAPNPSHKSSREIFLLQRNQSKLGANLGKTTGWIHRTSLKNRGVNMIKGVSYSKIDDEGLHIAVNGKPQVLDVDHVVICAGQVSEKSLWKESPSQKYFLIGGAELASELDAKRAIDQGTRLASNIENAATGQVFNQPVPLSAKISMKALQFFKGN